MDGLVWIFAYGSLMWRPGFAYRAFEPALLEGWHRALCVYSYIYRGSPAHPGLVLGLDRGGRCHGRAIGIAPEREREVLAYLDQRELVTDVYRRMRLPVRLCRAGRMVEAWCYVVRRDHEQYAGVLPRDELLRLVRRGAGRAGSCRDYVLNTLAHLREMGIREPHLEAVAVALEE